MATGFASSSKIPSDLQLRIEGRARTWKVAWYLEVMEWEDLEELLRELELQEDLYRAEVLSRELILVYSGMKSFHRRQSRAS